MELIAIVRIYNNNNNNILTVGGRLCADNNRNSYVFGWR